MLDELLSKRALPFIINNGEDAKERNRKNLRTLIDEEYGEVLKPVKGISAVIDYEYARLGGGKGTYREITLTVDFGDDAFSFPIKSIMPNTPGEHPCFVNINFNGRTGNWYLPMEEILDRGYGVFTFDYEAVALDLDHFEVRPEHEPLKDIIFKGVPKEKQCGNLAIWAWAASRVLDYVLTLPNVDKNLITVVGHSRLGKTALLAGATDERFACAASNCSGCSGAAISRDKIGENIEFITKTFDYWFLDRYKKYASREQEMPFDQHYLIGAMAPRLVYVNSASMDDWADPASEYLSCVAASDMYKAFGKGGLTHPDRLPEPGDHFDTGNIGYHLRYGTHFFSREDWGNLINFLNRHRKYF